MKIGFIDYYLDEWHANNYPAWLKKADPEMEVAYGYAMVDKPQGRTTEQWCADNGVIRCHTVEELVEKSDVLMVLSPDNCELHEALSQTALCSGKRLYIDKTFAPDEVIGRRIFDLAQAHGTPCWSTSALRFSKEYRAIDTEQVQGIVSMGGNSLETYSIHQLEPVIMLMRCPVRRVLGLEGKGMYTAVLEFEDGRIASINGVTEGFPFILNVAMRDGSSRAVEPKEDFFQPFIQALVDFYLTGEIPVSHEETLEIAAVRAAIIRAMKTPGCWTEV